MDDAERIPSPDGVYTVILVAIEMRMSHWLAQPRIIETATNRTVLDLTETLWSADAVRWADDSSRVTLDMRRYPGDAPGITAIIDLHAACVEISAAAETAILPHADLPAWLEAYYARYRR